MDRPPEGLGAATDAFRCCPSRPGLARVRERTKAGAFAFFHILNLASGYAPDTSRTLLFLVGGLLVGFSLVSVALLGVVPLPSNSFR